MLRRKLFCNGRVIDSLIIGQGLVREEKFKNRPDWFHNLKNRRQAVVAWLVMAPVFYSVNSEPDRTLDRIPLEGRDCVDS